jgi:hypothetical protein
MQTISFLWILPEARPTVFCPSTECSAVEDSAVEGKPVGNGNGRISIVMIRYQKISSKGITEK